MSETIEYPRPKGFIATKDELTSVAEDTEANLNELRLAHNAHAEVLNLHRYLLDKFIPQKLLESACNEYYELRKAEIEKEKAKANGPHAQA